MTKNKSFSEILRNIIDQENLHRTENGEGVNNLCKLVDLMGYTDNYRYGQLANGSSHGNLLSFLSDNPGAIEALHRWIKENGNGIDEWKESLESNVNDIDLLK